MKIKLIINSRLSYYFCGSISLSILNTVDNPLDLNLESLTKQEVIGLNKAVKTGIIKVLEGEAELVSLAESLIKPKFKKEEEVVTEEVEVKEETIEDVVEIKEEEFSEDEVKVQEEKETEPVIEVEEVQEVKPTPRRRSATKK